MTGHAGRGTPRQALAGLAGAVVVGCLVWAAVLPPAWRALGRWCEVMWP